MKTKRLSKILVLSIFAILMAVSGVALLCNNTKMAVNAEGTGVTSTVFKMVDGTSLRYSQDGKGGLRFRVQMDETVKTTIEDTNTTFGFIIAPTELFKDVVDGDYSKLADKVTQTGDKTAIYKEGDSYYANCVLISILEENRKLNYNAVAYYTVGDKTTYATVDVENGYSNYYELTDKLAKDAEEAKNILKDSAYSWYGTKSTPISVDTIEEYNELVTVVNGGVDYSTKYVRIDNAVDKESGTTITETSKFPTAIYYVTLVNGEDSITKIVEENGTIDVTSPTKQYYTFNGFYNGATLWDVTTDKVTSDLTLTAQFSPTVYTVQFKNGETVVATKTYTVENVTSFTLPDVPTLEHYENGRWDKTLVECTNYTEGTLTVNATYTPKTYTITFDANGGSMVDSQSITYSETARVQSVTTTRGEFVLDGWYNDSTKWDFDTSAVTGSITLKAKWMVKKSDGSLLDITAYDTSLCEAVINATSSSYAQASAIVNYTEFHNLLTETEQTSTTHKANVSKVNAIMDLYFADNLILSLSNPITTTATVDGGYTYYGDCNGNVEVGWHNDYKTNTYEHNYVTQIGDPKTVSFALTKIAFNSYEEVSFGFYFISSDGYTKVEIGDSSFEKAQNENWYCLVVVKNGVMTIYDDRNGQASTTLVTKNLSESELNGNEALIFTISVTKWSQIEFTEMLATKSAEKITINGETLIDNEFKDNTLYSAITSATNGSEAQYLAIEKYREFHNSLTMEQKAVATHTAKVAEINNIIDTYFANGFDYRFENVPTVVGDKCGYHGSHTGAGYGESGSGPHHSAYTTEKLKSANGTTYYYVKTGGSTAGVDRINATITLPAVAYKYYDEVIFGFFFYMSGATASFKIGDKTITITQEINYYYKVEIKNGVLTLYNESDNSTVLTITLSDNILNGSEGLIITLTDYCYSVEFTTVYATKLVAKIV